MSQRPRRVRSKNADQHRVKIEAKSDLIRKTCYRVHAFTPRGHYERQQKKSVRFFRCPGDARRTIGYPTCVALKGTSIGVLIVRKGAEQASAKTRYQTPSYLRSLCTTLHYS